MAAGPLVGWLLALLAVYHLLGSGYQNAYIYGAIVVVALQVVNFWVA